MPNVSPVPFPMTSSSSEKAYARERHLRKRKGKVPRGVRALPARIGQEEGGIPEGPPWPPGAARWVVAGPALWGHLGVYCLPHLCCLSTLRISGNSGKASPESLRAWSVACKVCMKSAIALWVSMALTCSPLCSVNQTNENQETVLVSWVTAK